MPLVPHRGSVKSVPSNPGDANEIILADGRPHGVTPNVKHQRARATASRVKDELSLRALRCMR